MNLAILLRKAYFSHELCVDLGYPVDGPGPLNAEIRCRVPRRGSSKSSNRAGHKQSHVELGCNI